VGGGEYEPGVICTVGPANNGVAVGYLNFKYPSRKEASRAPQAKVAVVRQSAHDVKKSSMGSFMHSVAMQYCTNER
jgi:hypothetical protein